MRPTPDRRHFSGRITPIAWVLAPLGQQVRRATLRAVYLLELQRIRQIGGAGIAFAKR
jgi:hypothetical protein